MTRLLVCGSRTYADREFLFSVLDAYLDQGIEVIIEGCAKGADRLAEEWAAKRRVAIVHNPADWGQHGRAAGAIRNRQMANRYKPQVVIAFYSDPLKPSKGTADMVAVAASKKIPVVLA